MVISLRVLTDIYTQPDKNGNSKLIKKDVEYKKMFETNGLLAEHYLSKKGVPSKRWCLVKEGDSYFRLNHKFEEIEKLIKPVEVKGFKK
jgi:hypothetical protein